MNASCSYSSYYSNSDFKSSVAASLGITAKYG